jgi:putative ABC transport system substrate-binding protein
MINRRRLIGAIASGALAEPFGAHSQPKEKVWRIGYIGIAPPGTSPESERLVGIFMRTLRDNGFVEGKNFVLERRATEGRPDRASPLAAALVGLHVDLMVTLDNDAALAAKAATTTIPIVMMGVSDPVASRLAVSLARPGGNVTGLSDFSLDLTAKRLELLKAAAPKAVRVAFLHDDEARRYGTAKGDAIRRELGAAAKALGISLVRIPMDSPLDFQEARAAIVREHVDAIVAGAGATYSVRQELADFAIQQRLPSMVSARPIMTGGALMSYGADYSDIFRKAATYVAKILNGANPADLPIEEPTKVALVINLKTAKAIGFTIPQSLLLSADEVIQ